MSGNLSLERGLSVLRTLRDAGSDLGVREIARRLDLSAPAVQRILNTLSEEDYVEQDPESRRYRLGYNLLSLARHALNQDILIQVSEPELSAFAGEDCFNSFLGTRVSGKGLYLLAIQSRSPVVIRSSPGDQFSLHSTALGKALLWGLDRDEVGAILGTGPLEKLTDKTATTADALLGHLTSAVERGYTTSIDENFAGLIAVGAPILSPSGSALAAISVAYPRSVGPRVDIPALGKRLGQAANRISARLRLPGSPATQSGGSRNAA
ncbi:transcriptional regulator, IclR family [Rhizobiales bacterium GAS188]|nr:transcriptional regulator, IclR family [Rhizobiales bacterium GAS188]